jgi:hypothetical protein
MVNFFTFKILSIIGKNSASHLFLLYLALLFNPQKNFGHVRLQHHAAHHKLVHNVVNLKDEKNKTDSTKLIQQN